MKTLEKKKVSKKLTAEQKDMRMRLNWLKGLKRLQRDTGVTDAVKFIHDNR